MYFSGSTWSSLPVLMTAMRIPAVLAFFSEWLKRKNRLSVNTRKCLLSELPHKKNEGFAYSDYLPWSDNVPDWVREGNRSGKEQRKSGIGHGYYPPPAPFLLYVVIFHAYEEMMVYMSFQSVA